MQVYATLRLFHKISLLSFGPFSSTSHSRFLNLFTSRVKRHIFFWHKRPAWFLNHFDIRPTVLLLQYLFSLLQLGVHPDSSAPSPEEAWNSLLSWIEYIFSDKVVQ